MHIIHSAGEEVYFSDNSGMLRYFINLARGRISSSLLKAEEYNKRDSYYSAFAQFLLSGCTYDNETIVKISANNTSYGGQVSKGVRLPDHYCISQL